MMHRYHQLMFWISVSTLFVLAIYHGLDTSITLTDKPVADYIAGLALRFNDAIHHLFSYQIDKSALTTPTPNITTGLGITDKLARNFRFPANQPAFTNAWKNASAQMPKRNHGIHGQDHTVKNSAFNVCSSQNTFLESRTKYKNYIDIEMNVNASDSQKTILLWNPMFTQEDYGIGLGDHVFKACDCPVTCQLTRDLGKLETADAVLIHTFFLHAGNVTLPKRSRSDQIFVFFLLESPLVAAPGMGDVNYTDVFNLTMTYLDHPDTDIYTPPGDFVEVASSVPSADSISSKRKQIAWIVSNCSPLSNRMGYVEELSRYIEIDTHGGCGNISCPIVATSECMKNISRDYWFYLAFENCYCEGYMTEKVYRTLSFDIVPIVYGGANFSAMLPQKSYIDVHSFSSPEQLAKYLLYLSQNPGEYLEYFHWKNYWSVRGDYHHRARGFCKLCQVLNSGAYRYKTAFDLASYWDPARLCLLGAEERGAVHMSVVNEPSGIY